MRLAWGRRSYAIAARAERVPTDVAQTSHKGGRDWIRWSVEHLQRHASATRLAGVLPLHRLRLVGSANAIADEMPICRHNS